MFSPKAVMLCLQIWALWFWLSLQIWNFENIFHSLTSNNWIKYSELCLPCYLMIFNRFFDPIIGSLIHNSINLVMFPFYNWHLSSSQSLKLIEDLFCDTLLPNIGSFDSKIELVDDYFLQCLSRDKEEISVRLSRKVALSRPVGNPNLMWGEASKVTMSV